MKIELNPVKLFKKDKPSSLPVVPAAVVEKLMVVQQAKQSSTSAVVVSENDTKYSAKAVENSMSTTVTTVAAAAAAQPNGFIRFIDAIGHFFVKSAPVIEAIAVEAEPFLALTPFGPEYDLVVNAIVGAQQTATASLATGATLTGSQKMALVLQAVTPGLSQILASKKVTSGIPDAINQFAQNVFNLQTEPTTTVPPVCCC